MYFDEFEKTFQKIEDEVNSQFDIGSPFYEQFYKELEESNKDKNLPDSELRLIAAYQVNREYTKTLIYSLAHKYLKDRSHD